MEAFNLVDRQVHEAHSWHLHRRAQRRINRDAYESLLDAVRAAYDDSPSLTLTLPEAQRRWRASGILVGCVLEELVDLGVLRRMAAGRYGRQTRER